MRNAIAGGDALVMGLSVLLRRLIRIGAESRGLDPAPADLLFLTGDPVDVPNEVAAHVAVRANSGTFNSHWLGSVYESLIDRSTRKNRGVFYTPQSIVERIVRDTIDPVLKQGTDPSQLRILDPAMGTGHFLVAATRYLAHRLNITPAAASKHLYGVDLDPIAVDLARASMWLEIGSPDLSPADFFGRLCCGDSLLDATLDHERFDVVLGNPPYGSSVGALTRRLLVERLPQMRHNGDAAIGFLERSSHLLAPGGRCGLIVPKPLTYSYSWRRMREFLGRRVEQVIDVSRAWREVKLEQVIVIFGDQPGESYCASWLDGLDFSPRVTLSWSLAERFGTLPCALDEEDLRTLDRLVLGNATLGGLVKTWRGLPLQRDLASHGDSPVIGGRDLARWNIRGTSGFVAKDAVVKSIESFAQPKLVFQNIVAHIGRPQPHIQLIGAYDGQGTITLDTVNNLTPRVPDLPLHGVLALLHSRLVNWFVYSVIYNKAIRTMHFDQYFLNKIPLPADYFALLQELAPLAIAAERNDQIASAAIDRAVNAAYGVPDFS